MIRGQPRCAGHTDRMNLRQYLNHPPRAGDFGVHSGHSVRPDLFGSAALAPSTLSEDRKARSMDWQTLFSIVGIVLFIALMMRGGGMGCCGIGSHGKRHSDAKTERSSERVKEGPKV